MRSFNDSFNRYVINNKSADMRFTIEVQWDALGTELVYFLSHSDSAAPVGASSIHSINSISSTSQALNNRYAIAEIGSLTFMLADVGDNITSELSDRFDSGITAVQKKATVYAGTKEMDFVDYEPIDVWYINDISHTGPGYRFNGSDIQRFLRQKIFTPDKSRLSATMTASQSHIPLTVALGSTLFPAVTHDSLYTYNPSVSVGYVKIDKEIIAHDGTIFSHGTDGPSLGVVTRGALNTVAEAHTTDVSSDEDNGKEVIEIIYIEGSVVDIIHLAMSGENVAGSATIPDHWNAGIDTGIIDSTTFTAINSELSARRLRFIGEKEQDAKQFIEQQAQRFNGLFQTVTSNGTFKLHKYARTIEESSPVAYAYDDDISEIGNLDQSGKDVVNVYNIDFNYDYITERFTRGINFLDSSSYNANGGLIKSEKYQFKGVHSALHTDNDIRNFIYQTRELYSNPPYRTKVKLNNKFLGVEVGDVIHIETTARKNYITGLTTLSRPFLVSRRSVDFGKAEVSLDLIGTGLSAQAILDPGAVGSVGELTTAYLTGEGTNLESLANVSGGTMIGDVTLTGGTDMNATGSIFYLDGNFTIATGTTLTLVNNVQIRVTGQIVRQAGSIIDARGNGLINASGSGYFGSTLAGSGTERSFENNHEYSINYPIANVIQGQVSSIPFYNIVNNEGSLTGLPIDLRGTPGDTGEQSSVYDYIGNLDGTAAGGAGGDGAAALITIARGYSFSPTSEAYFSGDDGSLGATHWFAPEGVHVSGGSGSGACPSGWLCIIDGDYTAPSSDTIEMNRGDSPKPLPFVNGNAGFQTTDMSAAAFRVQYVPSIKEIVDDGTTGIRTLSTPTGLTLENGTAIAHEDGTISEYILATWTVLNDADVEYYQLRAKRTTDPDYIIAAIVPQDEAEAGALIPADYGISYSVQIRATGIGVKPSAWSTAETFTVTSEVANPSDVTGFIVSQNGELVNFFWNLIADSNRDGYVLRFGPIGVTWEDATPLLNEGKGTKVTTAYVQNGNFDFLIKAINLQRKYSTNAARYNFTVLGLLDIINETDHDPDWTGTLVGYWHHYNDKLVPLDKYAASTYGYEMFDTVVPNPVDESSYETGEIDTGVDAMVRAWGIINSTLAGGATGIADPQLYFDHRSEGGSYDGYEQCSVLEIEARYGKFKLINDNTQGPAIIESFKSVLDSRERTEKSTNVTVAPGGTAVVFDQEFRLTPYIEVGVIGGGGLIAESASDATTGFTFHIYNSGGSSVGGTGKWKAIGV